MRSINFTDGMCDSNCQLPKILTYIVFTVFPKFRVYEEIMYIPLWWQIICKLQVCEHSSVDHIKQYTYDTLMWQSYQQCQKLLSVSGTDHQWHTESLSVPGAHARSSFRPFCLLQSIHFLSSTLCFQSEPCMVWKQQHRLNYSLKKKEKDTL